MRIVNCFIVVGCMISFEVVLVVGFMSMIGIFLLVLFNLWVVFFGILFLVFYVFVYILMKRILLVVVLIGVILGVFFMMIGCVVIEGYLSFLVVCFFGL